MIFIGWKLIMKTLGFTKVMLLPLMILVTTMGSSIASQIPPAASPTLEESTSCRREILSLHTTLGKVNYEETKQLFLHNVLTEALDDGTPMYYNSNILGRYMRKDYGNFERDSK